MKGQSQEIKDLRTKVKEGAPYLRKAEDIQARYARMCQRLHMATDLFALNFETMENDLNMSFRKAPYQVNHRLPSAIVPMKVGH
ncbi:hypothetical protein JCM12294_45940 [Desulfocicer niacini]